MKKLILLFTLLFSIPTYAQHCSKNMLEQLSNVNSGWHPVLVDPLYVIKKSKAEIIVLRLYDSSKLESDPEGTDVQAVFIKTKNGCMLAAIVMAPLDVRKYIDVLVE